MEFQTFDAEYVRRLAAGDPETEAHFSVYFGQFLSLKLRSRYIPSGAADDVRQETLLRVLKTLRQGPGVAKPERFGGFVNSVCNNVLLELNYKASREPAADEDSSDPPDRRIDIDASLITAERKRLVEAALKDLEPKDRELLRLVFFENAGRKDICRKLNVQPGYLRVLLHRAKGKFQAAYVRKQRPITRLLLLTL